jgi:bifunctional DNase/RNase
MIEVTVDSIRVSLISHHRVVVLKEVGSSRFLPIWIGQFEADAITLGLQGVEIARPLTHDLIKSILDEAGAIISHILVSELQDDTFYARIVIDLDGRHAEVDARPSDAIALAVRARVPIYVVESVMDRAAIVPSGDEGPVAAPDEDEDSKLSVFRDFVDSLDLGDLDASKGDEE